MAAVAGLAALALGGSAIADAATKSNTTTTPQGTAARQGPPPAGARANRQARPPAATWARTGSARRRSADVAAKVKAAALDKVSGGTVERVETDVDHGSPYEAHVRKADGTQLEVLVNESFEVTAVNTMMPLSPASSPPRRGARPRGRALRVLGVGRADRARPYA